MPPDDLRLSVYDVSGLSEAHVWSLGRKYVGDPQGKSVKARADLPARGIREAALEVVHVPDPHPRHAEVIGWPEDRTKQRVIAMRLAQISIVQFNPNA